MHIIRCSELQHWICFCVLQDHYLSYTFPHLQAYKIHFALQLLEILLPVNAAQAQRSSLSNARRYLSSLRHVITKVHLVTRSARKSAAKWSLWVVGSFRVALSISSSNIQNGASETGERAVTCAKKWLPPVRCGQIISPVFATCRPVIVVMVITFLFPRFTLYSCWCFWWMMVLYRRRNEGCK
jgi:hypothetical protein